MAKKLKKTSSKKIITIGKKPVKQAKAKDQKATSVKKTVKAIAKALKPVKKSKPAVVKQKTKPATTPQVAPEKPVAETVVKPVKETPVAPAADFKADLLKSESIAATTIEKKESYYSWCRNRYRAAGRFLDRERLVIYIITDNVKLKAP